MLKDYLHFDTDGGRKEHGFEEKGDCTVRALALATGRPYAEAHAFLATKGRKPKKGFAMARLLKDGAEILGHRVTEECPRQRLSTVLPTLAGKGETHIARKSGHVFAVYDGMVFDNGKIAPGSVITHLWKFEKIND